jgi:16S rRNA (cytosine1402-N4)-methyltransferase
VIARRIVEDRQEYPIETIGDLMEIIKKALPPKYRSGKHGGTYASKIFRALRMEVNDELGVVDTVIPQAVEVLHPGGRLVVITFHSLEDRLVKHSFRNLSQGEDSLVKLVTKKAIKPTEDEILENSRAASAMVRVIEKK